MITKENLYIKKLSEILDLDSNELEDRYREDLEKLKEIVNSRTDYIILKIAEDNLYTSVNDNLCIKNVEFKSSDSTYIIEEIELNKFFIFYEVLKSNDIKLLIELNKELTNISYKDYEELFNCFTKESLIEEHIKIIKDFSIKNATQFKVLKHLDTQMDKYKRYTLNTIKSLL